MDWMIEGRKEGLKEGRKVGRKGESTDTPEMGVDGIIATQYSCFYIFRGYISVHRLHLLNKHPTECQYAPLITLFLLLNILILLKRP